jgi:lipopolysaccharide export system protein LptA
MKLFISTSFIIFFFAISISTSPGVCLAAEKKLFDTSQPVSLKSKHILVNQKNGSITYKGNVRLKQGDLLIIAGKAKTRAVGGQPGQVWASGNPVKVQNKKDGNLLTITAANVHYNVKSGMIVLTGNVQLHFGKDALNTKKLSYNVKTNTITVNTKNAPLNAAFDSDYIKALRK